MKDVLSKLDEKHRENVVHVKEDGTIISNKKQLKEEFITKNAKLIGKDGKLIKKPSAWVKDEKTEPDQPSLLPLSIQSTGWKYPDYQSENVNSGPYRRVFSNTGYSRLRGNLSLPAKNNGVYMSSLNDKAYAYTGAVDSGGKGIDIGLAYNYESGDQAHQESWGMFMAGSSNVTMPSNKNFQGGQTVYIDFYTWATNAVALYAEGYNRAGYFVGSTLTAELGSSYKFYADGTGMKVKRITSIAQSPQNLTSGSEINYVGWNNIEIGQRYNPAVSQNWGLFYGYPKTSILVDYTDQSNEKVRVKTGTLYP